MAKHAKHGNHFQKLPRSAFKGNATRKFLKGKVANRLRGWESETEEAIRSLELASSIEELSQTEPSLHKVPHLKHLDQLYAIDITARFRLNFDWPDGEPHPFNIQITDHYKPFNSLLASGVDKPQYPRYDSHKTTHNHAIGGIQLNEPCPPRQSSGPSAAQP